MKKVITVHKNGLSNTWLLRIFLLWTFVSKMTHFIIIVCYVFFLSYICQYLVKSMPDYYPEKEILMLLFLWFYFFLWKMKKLSFLPWFPQRLFNIYVHYIHLTQQQQSLYIHCYFKTPFDDDVYHIFFYVGD